MTPINWGALFRKIIADLKANKPLATSPAPMTTTEVVALLEGLQAELPKAISLLSAYPGLIASADDIAEVLEEASTPEAAKIEAEVKAAIDGAPGFLASSSRWLPGLLFALREIQPAATGIVGDGPTAYRGK
jgi:hypothetical protein